jgi:hypothetical protein
MTGVLVEFLGSGGVLMLAGVVLVKLERQRWGGKNEGDYKGGWNREMGMGGKGNGIKGEWEKRGMGEE